MDKNISVLMIILLCSVFSNNSFSQEIRIKGRVIDENSSPVVGVNVVLVGIELETKTDNNGLYEFIQGSSIKTPYTSVSGFPSIKGNSLMFRVSDRIQTVTIDILDMRGRKQANSFQGQFQRGNHSIKLNTFYKSLASRIYVLRFQIGARQYLFKGMLLQGRAQWAQPSFSNNTLNTLSTSTYTSPATVDSLHFYLKGYDNVVHFLNSLVSDVPDITLKSGIAFEPYFQGSGDIIDLKNMDSIHIAMENRLHVVVFPEGYLQQDIDDGEYDEDLDKWWNDVFVLKVPEYLKEAFIIWRYDAPSIEQLTGDGTVNSFFKIPLVDGMLGSGFDIPAANTWNAVSYFPFPPKDFPSTIRGRNMIWSYMLFDPERERSGYSGKSTTFSNPDNSSQRVKVAMALGHQHEFMHAMACLSDEYYDVDHNPTSNNSLIQESRYITNVIVNQNRSTLPWKHLLFGGQ